MLLINWRHFDPIIHRLIETHNLHVMRPILLQRSIDEERLPFDDQRGEHAGHVRHDDIVHLELSLKSAKTVSRLDDDQYHQHNHLFGDAEKVDGLRHVTVAVRLVVQMRHVLFCDEVQQTGREEREEA